MIINGENKSFNSNITLMELLIKLKYNPLNVAVELNGEIVAKRNYESTLIKNDDVMEIVSFVGGG